MDSGKSHRKVIPYSVLAGVYDTAWADFCISYMEILPDYISLSGSRVLDLACGTGELLYHLGEAGAIDPTGVDISPEMVRIARGKVPDASIVEGDICEIRLRTQFDLVTCTHDAVNYLADVGELALLFETARLHTKSGGLFAFDFTTPIGYTRLNGSSRRILTFRGPVTQSLSYDKTSGIAETKFTFNDGSVEVHRQRPFTEEEVFSVLTEFNFEVLDEFDVDDEDPEKAEGTLLWVTRGG